MDMLDVYHKFDEAFAFLKDRLRQLKEEDEEYQTLTALFLKVEMKANIRYKELFDQAYHDTLIWLKSRVLEEERAKREQDAG